MASKREIHPGETTTYNVAVAVFLSDKIKGPTNVVASALLADIHRYDLYQQTTKRGYAALSAQHAEKLHPEFNRNTIISALQLLEKTNLVTVIRPANEDRLPNGKRPASEYKLTSLAYQFFSKPDKDDEDKPEPKAKKKEVDNSYAEQIREVIEHLNAVAGKRYRPGTIATDKYIRARLNEGFTVDDLIAVIDYKAEEWKGKTFMVHGKAKPAADYLRPQTLFSPEKFQTYLNEIPVKNMQEIFTNNDNLTDEEIYNRLWRFGVLEDRQFGFGIDIHEDKLKLCNFTEPCMSRAKKLLEKEIR